MKQCLVDANVLLSLLVQRHVHHGAARSWFDRLHSGEAGVCRMVQLSVVRLLGNRAVMAKDPLPASAAWQLLAELLDDERLEFLAEPVSLDDFLPKFFRCPVPTGNLIADAYLAAFAVAASRRMATFDRGFRQFDELEVDLLPG
jgi:toxin-antitoxin system PIN domain toxin